MAVLRSDASCPNGTGFLQDVAARHADLLAAWQVLAADGDLAFEDPSWAALADAWETHVLGLVSTAQP